MGCWVLSYQGCWFTGRRPSWRNWGREQSEVGILYWRVGMKFGAMASRARRGSLVVPKPWLKAVEAEQMVGQELGKVTGQGHRQIASTSLGSGRYSAAFFKGRPRHPWESSQWAVTPHLKGTLSWGWRVSGPAATSSALCKQNRCPQQGQNRANKDSTFLCEVLVVPRSVVSCCTTHVQALPLSVEMLRLPTGSCPWRCSARRVHGLGLTRPQVLVFW